VQNHQDQLNLAREAQDAFGQIDAIFANAGRGGEPGGFSEADPQVWRDMILTNVLGVGMTVQACLPALRASRGHVLLTGSVAGRVTIPGSMYSATKWAVSAIGHGLREELRGSGIRVTLIEPGMVDTAFFDKPPVNALQPEDIARAVLYALSQPPHVDVNEVLVRPTSVLE
jgi:NADP-dependent 3-hydroxy acid dehydrogenase YdfG